MWNNFFMGTKFNFKLLLVSYLREWNAISNFKIWKKFMKDFLVIFFYIGFLCKMNPDSNYRQFFCKIFCWWPPMWKTFLWERNSILNYFWWATSRSPDRPPAKRFSDFLKLGTLQVHDIQMCAIFEFWWNNFMGMKLYFKFQNLEKVYKGIPCNFFNWNSFVKFSVGGPRCDGERPPDLPTSRPPAKRFSDFVETWHTWSSR